MIWSIGALGLGILVGFTGQISVAHSTFLGIGAYSSALLTLRLGFPFWICLFLSGLISGIVGIAIGYPFLRLRGHYFAISTLAFCILMEQIFSNWKFLTFGPAGVTMGPGEVMGIPSPKGWLPGIGSFELHTKISYYYLTLGFFLIALYIMNRLLRSKSGRALIGMREDEDLARSIGIDPTKYKLFAFFLSSFYAGIGGSLYAHYIKFLSANSFNFLESFYFLMAVIMGGRDSIPGMILGAILINLLPEFLSFPYSAPLISAVSIAILATVLILIIIFLPNGLIEFPRIIKNTFFRRKEKI